MELLGNAFRLPLAAVLGAMIGSFLNVVIYRVPRGKSIVRPGSACPACDRKIRPWENVPILSYVFLRGRCGAAGRAFRSATRSWRR